MAGQDVDWTEYTAAATVQLVDPSIGVHSRARIGKDRDSPKHIGLMKQRRNSMNVPRNPIGRH